MTSAVQPPTVNGEPLAVVLAQSPSIAQILMRAVEQNLSVESLERLVALHERMEDRAAAQEFADSLAKFQATVPMIRKTSTAKILPKAGGAPVVYNYAELDEIVGVVRPRLHALGFSYQWDNEITGSMLTCTCTLRHVNGHAVTAKFSCPTTSGSPLMSEPQKVASALQFARRMALVQVLGLTMTEPDTDGADPTTITEIQAQDLAVMASDAGVNLDKLFRYLRVESFDQVRATDINKAVAAIESHVKAKAEKAARAAT